MDDLIVALRDSTSEGGPFYIDVQDDEQGQDRNQNQASPRGASALYRPRRLLVSPFREPPLPFSVIKRVQSTYLNLSRLKLLS